MIPHPRTAPNLDASAPSPPYPSKRRWATLCWTAITLCCPQPVLAGETGGVIRIAVVGPATGPQRFVTRAIEAGARRAIGELSGPGQPELELVLEDDGCDGAIAEAKAHELVSAGVDVVLGHPCAKAAVAAAAIYAEAGVVFMATHTRHPALTAKPLRPSIFRLCGRDDAQGADAARLLSLTSGGKPIAVVHDRTLYAKTIAERAVRALHGAARPDAKWDAQPDAKPDAKPGVAPGAKPGVAPGAKPQVISATIIAGHKQYTHLTEKIKDAGAVFFAGFPLEAGFIAGELEEAGSPARFIASDAVASRELTATFPELASRIEVLMPAEGNEDALARAAVEIFMHASARAYGPFQQHWRSDKASRRALAATILRKNGPHASTSGPIAFNASGDADVTSFRLMRWDQENWVPTEISP